MDFLKLLGVSAVLAIGFGIWFSDSWLGAFANRNRADHLAICNRYFIGHGFSYPNYWLSKLESIPLESGYNAEE